MNRNQNNTIQNTTATHRETLKKNLEHRIEVARAKGDESLVRQLEAEASYLGLN